MGIAEPKYTKTPNTLFDSLMRDMGIAELKVTLALTRETSGYHRAQAEVSLADLKAMTGLSRQGVINGVNAGIRRGTITRSEGKRNGFVYALSMNDECDLTSQASGLVNEIDQSTSQVDGLPLVKPVDQSPNGLVKPVDHTSQAGGLELVNVIDHSTPTLKKEKETIKESTEEKEETHAGDPLSVAWRQTYADVAMPPKLAASLQKLVTECGMAATLHGIKASAAKTEGRNYLYIAECARNYVPPPPLASYAGGSVYSNGTPLHVGEAPPEIPGVVAMPPTNGHKPPPLPAPMPTDDPWAIVVGELMQAAPPWVRWLSGSYLELNGELAGEPLYRVVLTEPGANAEWLTQQAEPAIRKKLASVLHRRILLEITTERVTV